MTVTVALIGLGEVGRVFAEDLRARGIEVAGAWDTQLGDASSRPSANAAELGIEPAASGADAVAGCDVVVSAVTAMNCVAAAESAAPGIGDGAYFFDLNSSSPGHKRDAQAAIEAAGGRYVEAALMSPIEPRRLMAPFILGGPHAATFVADAGAALGLDAATVGSDQVGVAAATKLCRSVVVKGLESLLAESLLSARYYGVEREVLDSLSNILPEADWDAIAGYFVSRSLEHGVRRSEEMAEAAATVAEAGVTPWMSRASVERQRWAAQWRDALPQDGGPPADSTVALIDAIRASAGLPAPLSPTGDDA